MRNYQVLLTFVFFNMSQGAIGQETSSTNELAACAYDRAAMLALEEDAFDQDMDGGWRALARDPNCWDVAADLIRDYRETRGLTSLSLYWHEGQLRAFMGDVQTALQLFESSYRSEDGGLGWNIYVDATIAFMKQDMPALVAAREALLSLPQPETPWVDAKGNDIEPPPWPPNLRVVDGLIQCFDRPYSEAYGRCED